MKLIAGFKWLENITQTNFLKEKPSHVNVQRDVFDTEEILASEHVQVNESCVSSREHTAVNTFPNDLALHYSILFSS